jgi:predicted  nucleic acid-binding Zn-ribbon protein
VNVKDMSTELESLKCAYIDLEEQRDAVREIHAKSVTEFDGRIRDISQQLQASNQDKAKYRDEISRLNNRLLERSNEIDMKTQELADMRTKLTQV